MKTPFLHKTTNLCLRIVMLIACLGGAGYSLNAQKAVTKIYGDVHGYYESSTSSRQSFNRSNNLIGFEVDGTTYSTGVNDSILTVRGVTYTPEEYHAFTVTGDIDYQSSELLGVGAYWDDVLQDNSSTDYIRSMNPIIPSYFMRDGTNGLELGTNFFNIKSQTIVYDDILINPAAGFGDGIPDIIATQTGAPSSGNRDIFQFTDISGVTVGNKVEVNFSSVSIVGVTYWSIYRVSTSTGTVSSMFAVNSPRDLRLLTFDFEDFGITADSISKVTTMVHYTSGSTDIAFTAFNKKSLSFIPVDLVISSQVNLPGPLCSANTLELVTTVDNVRSSNSTGFEVDMPIPAGLDYVSSNSVFSGGAGSASYNSSTNVWSVTGLEHGESVEFTIEVSVSSLVLPITYTNTIGNMVEDDYDQSDNTVTISIDDSDCDGLLDSEDLDDDNDGILDTEEGEDDTDGDGIINRIDLDSDNDGIYDYIEAGGNTAFDADNDGRIDAIVDVNDNGVHDLYDVALGGTALDNDADNDGVLDAYEGDSDDDGCADAIEAGMTDGDDDTYVGEAPITVDTEGRVITSQGNALVAGTSSYVTPQDLNTNGTYDFQEVTTLLALVQEPAHTTITEHDDVTFSIGASTAEHIQWQVNDGYGWADVSDGGVYSGSMTTALTLTNPDKATYDNYLYRASLSSPAYACTNDTLSEVCRLNIDDISDVDISGYVFSEQDINNNIVDGDLISNLDGHQLSVILYKADGVTIVDIAPVVNGDYVFYNVPKQTNYVLALDTGLYTSLYTSHNHSLPQDWHYSGEIQNKADNSKTGNDGTIDGKFSFKAKNQDVEYVNFSVLYAPKGDNVLTCYNDSTLAGWNPTFPAEKMAMYTPTLPWEYNASGSDYPGDTLVVDYTFIQTVSYWVEWELPYLNLTYRDTCQQVFTYKVDTIDPTAVCQDVTIYLDSTGVASVSVDDVDGGSSDNVALESRALDNYDFDCDSLGTRTVELTVTDSVARTDNCEATITVLDTIAPWLSAPLVDVAISTATYNTVDPSFVDNCTVTTLTWEMKGATSGSSPATGINYVGSTTFTEDTTTIVYTAQDASGNTTVDSFDVVYSIGCLEHLAPSKTGLGYDVYLVRNAADLVCLSNSSVYWDKHIWQVADIDFDVDNDDDYAGGTWGLTDGTVTIAEGDWNVDGSVDASDAMGFVMIGERYATAFTGVYQGATWDGTAYTLGVDRSIGHLFIDNSTVMWGYGLFAHTDGAVVENIHLEDVDINAAGQVGALIGYAVTSTEVANCSSSGLIVGDGREVGGLIGYCNGIDMSRSSSSCTVVSEVPSGNATSHTGAGALIGKADWHGDIIECSASGDVYGVYTHNVGGLIGILNGATVEKCYATGYVQGNECVGGLVGYAQKSTITNAYSTGAIKGNSAVGAFAGVNDQSTCSYSYATGNVAQSGATVSLGGFAGEAVNTPVFTTCYYDGQTTGAIDSLLSDVGDIGNHANIDTLSSSYFNVSGNFSLSSPTWSFDANASGRPYLAWQNDGSSYNVSNPVPVLISHGFSQDATSLGTGVLAFGLRYTNLDSLPQSWLETTAVTNSSGQLFTIEVNGLGDGYYYVQPFIIKADGSREYGDMSCFEVVDFPIYISTDSVTTITETTAKLYANISEARGTVEYGFYYSDTLTNITPVNVKATEVQLYSGVLLDLFDVDVTATISSLTNREGMYFKFYLVDTTGNYFYGDVKRFISDGRDFSLELDGTGDAVVIDQVSTAQDINDWGTANNTFSFDFWVKRNNVLVDKQVLISNEDGANGYDLYLENGTLILANPVGELATASLKIEDEEWHHVAVSYSVGNAIIYVDDNASSTQAMTIVPPVDNNCFIGASYDAGLDEEFLGYLDAMRFWNVALTADQVVALAYDNVQINTGANTIEGVATGSAITGLQGDDLTVSLGFNVKSTVEADKDLPGSFVYVHQDDLPDYPFFHNDARLGEDNASFNVLAVGNAKPSPYLPRVHWRADNTNDAWLTSSNWGGGAFPGQGIPANTYYDVSASALANDSMYCRYAIVSTSTTNPEVNITPPAVQVLVDHENATGTYHVDNTASQLRILNGIIPALFNDKVDSVDGEIVIDEGSVEVFSD